MLNYGNKEFRNLQEQVLKNMSDIKDIHEGATVLGEFGIKVVGQVDSAAELPSAETYDGEYGDAYVVGEETPYDYYIFTRPFEDVDDPQWFNLGQFPAPGPQGETGATGATGATPALTASASTSTLSAGQSATVSVSKSGTNENPHFSFTFAIPQGAQGIQGVQGAQGIQGPQGPQGIQGQKGDTGYLYTIIGQVNNESSLPLPGQVGRTSAFLVGSSEPYDVYIIIGQDIYDLEWLNIGPIATVVPTTYIASNTDASSGTLDASTLASITHETGVHYIRVGSELYEFANTYNGNNYYLSLRFDSSTSRNSVARFVVALSSGAWTTNSDLIPDTEHTVTTNTTQTITGSKTFGSVIKAGFTDVSLVGLNGVAGFRAYKPGTTTQAGQMIVTNDGTVAGSYRAVVQAYNGTLNSYNTLRIGDTEGFKYYVNNDNIFTIGNDGSIYGSPTPTTGGIKLYPDYSHASEYNSIRLYPNFTYSQAQEQDVMGDGYMEIKTHEILFGLTHYTSANDEWDEVGSFAIAPSTENPGYVALRGDAGIEIEADYGGNGAYLKLLYLPTSDPDESDAVFEASDGVLCMSGASYEPLPLSVVNGKLCVTYTSN